MFDSFGNAQFVCYIVVKDIQQQTLHLPEDRPDPAGPDWLAQVESSYGDFLQLLMVAWADRPDG